MFILFGMTNRTKTSSPKGEFYCTNCGTRRAYAEATIKRKLHIFFIPLITISKRKATQCTHCNTLFDADAPQRQTANAGMKAAG